MVKTNKKVSVATLSHPNSRKVHQLTKQIKKEAARKKTKNAHQMKQNLMGEKFLWFRDNLPQVSLLDHAAIAYAIKRYLERFDEELEQIQLKHSLGQRKNRQHANREDIIKLTKLQEMKEYSTSGIELPNLLLPSQLELLLKWNGELRFLQNFKLRRFSQGFLKTGYLKSRCSSPDRTYNASGNLSSTSEPNDNSTENTKQDISKTKETESNISVLETMETDLNE